MIGTISHSLLNMEFYKNYHHLDALKEEEFERLLKKKLSVHLKSIYKAILTHES